MKNENLIDSKFVIIFFGCPSLVVDYCKVNFFSDRDVATIPKDSKQRPSPLFPPKFSSVTKK